MKYEDFEKLADAASREWDCKSTPIAKPGYWRSIGPVTLGREQADADAAFIVACRTMVPKLLNVVKEAEKLIEKLHFSADYDDYEKAIAEMEKI